MVTDLVELVRSLEREDGLVPAEELLQAAAGLPDRKAAWEAERREFLLKEVFWKAGAREAEYLASRIQYAKLIPMWLLALICLLAYGSLMLWAGFRIDTGRDIPLAAILHMPSGWLISGLCLVAGVFYAAMAIPSLAEGKKSGWSKCVIALFFLIVGGMITLYLLTN